MNTFKNDSSIYEDPLEISIVFTQSFLPAGICPNGGKMLLYKDVYHSIVYNRKKWKPTKYVEITTSRNLGKCLII